MEIFCEGHRYILPEGTSPGDLWRQLHGDRIHTGAVLADCSGDVLDFHSPLPDSGGMLTWLPLSSHHGYLAAQRTLVMLLLCAVREIGGDAADVAIKHSLGQALYCEFPGGHIPMQSELSALEAVMRSISRENRPVSSWMMDSKDACEYLRKEGCYKEAETLERRGIHSFGMYRCGTVKGYFFGPMLPHMGCVPAFSLEPYAPGFLLRFPARGETDIAPYKEEPLFAKVFLEAEEWGEIIGCHNVLELNRAVSNGSIGHLVALAEAKQEKNLARLADRIYSEKPKIRLVCIAGPSSAGKTTFMRRLLVQLGVNGVRPVTISLDDFYRDRREETEAVNYENLSALDVPLFQEIMAALLEGRRVRLPRFDFQTGKRSWGAEVCLGADQPILVEGLHALNPELTHFVPGYQCLHIYLGALTQLSINRHNRISTTDTRLLRRLVRDARTRGNDAETTLSLWNTVRQGEEENIFLFQGRAEEIFNTALIYELPVLKKQAIPLLQAIGRESPQYAEAQRLLTFLLPFDELDAAVVPDGSILREFIGDADRRVFRCVCQSK